MHAVRTVFMAAAMATLCAATGPAAANSQTCQALRGQTFVLEGDTPAVIGRAKAVAASDGLPAHCAIEGFVAPQVGFEVRLPLENWNGRYLQQGCRGMCGFLNAGATDDALARGYAVGSTDMGHKAFSSQSGIWAVNNPQGKIDFGHRGTHLSAQAAAAVMASYYGTPAKTKYFRGCGTGGRQALVEAQRYPEDFDGMIVNGGVVFDFTRLNYLMAWNVRANIDGAGQHILSASDVETLHQAVLGACDQSDGIKDGIVSNPGQCDFDPAALACNASKDEDCFSAQQVEAARKMYAGPSRANGEHIYPGMPPGSEPRWTSAYFGDDPKYAAFGVEMMRYFLFPTAPGPSFQLADFDLNRSPAFFNETESLVSADSIDYADFKDRGGKILITHGWNESAMPGTYPGQYYKRLAQETGGIDATREFFRLYMIPGHMRCLSGTPEGRHFDYLGTMERWVEEGEAPDVLTGYELNTEPKYPDQVRYPLDAANLKTERPFVPYPDTLTYTGSGDPADVSSYQRKSP